MKRSLALIADAIIRAGMLSALTVVTSACGKPDAPPPKASEAKVHLPPIGFVNADTLPIKGAETWERTEDRESPPYHLLIRLLKWPDLVPVDIDESTQEIYVAGSAPTPLHIGAGEYLCSPIGVATTKVSLRERPPAPDWKGIAEGKSQLPARPQGRVLADRNPVALARHAVTICELVWIDEAVVDQPVEAHGTVYDASNAQPIPKATVFCGAFFATTDESGRFGFEAPLTLGDVLHSVVKCPGFEDQMISPRALTGTWIRHWKNTGEIVFTLRGSAEPRAPGLIRSEVLRDHIAIR